MNKDSTLHTLKDEPAFYKKIKSTCILYLILRSRICKWEIFAAKQRSGTMKKIFYKLQIGFIFMSEMLATNALITGLRLYTILKLQKCTRSATPILSRIDRKKTRRNIRSKNPNLTVHIICTV